MANRLSQRLLSAALSVVAVLYGHAALGEPIRFTYTGMGSGTYNGSAYDARSFQVTFESDTERVRRNQVNPDLLELPVVTAHITIDGFPPTVAAQSTVIHLGPGSPPPGPYSTYQLYVQTEPGQGGQVFLSISPDYVGWDLASAKPPHPFFLFGPPGPLVYSTPEGSVSFSSVSNGSLEVRTGSVGGPCTFTLSSSATAFSARGGSGRLAVFTQNSCNWSAVSDAPMWLTLGGFGCVGDICGGRERTGPGAVDFVVRPNTGVARTVNIAVGGQLFRVQQSGALDCSLAVHPSSIDVASNGGSEQIILTALPGCEWTIRPSVPWLHVVGNASGSGNARVRILADPNTGAARSGALTIAPEGGGTTAQLAVRQSSLASGTACGDAVDITDEVRVNRSGFTALDLFGRLVRQTITVTNTSGRQLTGPFYLIFRDMPDTHVRLVGHPSRSSCFSAHGDTVALLPVVTLGRGQETGYLPLFDRDEYWMPIRYRLRVVSGAPPIVP